MLRLPAPLMVYVVVVSNPQARIAGVMKVLLMIWTESVEVRLIDSSRSWDSKVSIPKRCQVGKSEGRSLSVGGRLKPILRAGKSDDWDERRVVEL